MSKELINVTVTVQVQVWADFIHEEHEGSSDYVFDDVDSDDIAAVAIQEIGQNNFSWTYGGIAVTEVPK